MRKIKNMCAIILAGVMAAINIVPTEAAFAIDTYALDMASQQYTITTYATQGGTITPTFDAEAGSASTVEVTLEEGYEVDEFKVDGVPKELKNMKYTLENITASHLVNVTFKKRTYLVDISSGDGGKIAGSKSVEHGSDSKYTITPSVGYEVDTLCVDGKAVSPEEDNTYTLLNVKESHSISVTFQKIICSVSMMPADNGEFTVTYNGADVEEGDILPYGSIIRMTNKADECYEFLNYEVNGEAVTSNSYKVTGPVEITAVFSEKTYEISTIVGHNGTLDLEGKTQIKAGEGINITAVPEKGYVVSQMLVNNEDVTDMLDSDNAYYTDDTWYGLRVQVTFEKQKISIYTDCTLGGTISPETEVLYGNDLTVAFSPEPGYEVTEVYVDGELVATSGTEYTLKKITEEHNVYVYFSEIVYNVNVICGKHGTSTGSGELMYGQNYDMEIIPDEGYQIDLILVNNNPVNAKAGKYTITNVTTDYDVKITFKKNEIAKVAIKSVKSAGFNKLAISWKNVEKAEGYEIYRKSENGTTYKCIADVSVGFASQAYIDSKRVCGRRYYYQVRAYRYRNGEKLYGVISDAKSGVSKPAKTAVEQMETLGISSVKISWSKVSGASGYEIFSSTSKDGSYKKIADISNNKSFNYVDKNLQKGTKYYYKIRAYRNADGQKIYGRFSKRKSGTTAYLDTVTGTKAKTKKFVYAHVTWNKVKDAEGYDIFWCARKKGTYEKIASVSAEHLEYEDKFYFTGWNYYKVRAYKRINGKKVYGCLSEYDGTNAIIR